MIFSNEESALINNCIDDNVEAKNRNKLIEMLSEAQRNTEDPELVSIAVGVINKLQSINDSAYGRIFADFPIDPYTTY